MGRGRIIWVAATILVVVAAGFVWDRYFNRYISAAAGYTGGFSDNYFVQKGHAEFPYSATSRVHTANAVKTVSCIVTPSGTGVSGEDQFVLDDVKGEVTHDDEIMIEVSSGGGNVSMGILSVSPSPRRAARSGPSCMASSKAGRGPP